jgi:uncharacterized membrane protein YjjB (DUF3815 family)
MSTQQLLLSVFWSGVFSAALAIILTAPPRYIATAFLCSAAGRLTRNLLVSAGWAAAWSTVVAAAVIVLVAALLMHRQRTGLVVLVSAVLPLGSAAAVFSAIVNLLRVSSLQGEALSKATDAFIAGTGQVFVTTLAIALGLAGGMATVRVIRRQPLWEGF